MSFLGVPPLLCLEELKYWGCLSYPLWRSGLTMGIGPPKSPQTPLRDVSWPTLGPFTSHLILSPQRLIFLCNQAWPQYPLDNASKWPLTGTFDPNILRDWYNFCEHAGKWKEIAYVQSFSYLRTKPSLCTSCSPLQVLLASKPTSKPTESSPEPPPSPCKQTSLHCLPYLFLPIFLRDFPVMVSSQLLLANFGLKAIPALGELMLLKIF
jgi:hypothetical protein